MAVDSLTDKAQAFPVDHGPDLTTDRIETLQGERQGSLNAGNRIDRSAAIVCVGSKPTAGSVTVR